MNLVYTKGEGGFLVMYVYGMLIIENDVGILSSVKWLLSRQFDMKDLGETSYILGVCLFQDCRKRMVALSQATYIDKMIEKFALQDAKKGQQPLIAGLTISLDDCPKTSEEKKYMSMVPYASQQ